MNLRIGTAGWSIPRKVAEHFAGEGSHLERYARQLNAVEINSSFYRPHQRKTYERWAATTPKDFRFSVKLPKDITHEARLLAVEDELDQFVSQIDGLGAKLGAILVQLPPSLDYQRKLSRDFFQSLRRRTSTPVVFEPRHGSWFTADVSKLLDDFSISRVAADPLAVPEAADPGGDRRVIYYRLHGSPRMYYSSYDDPYLAELARKVQAWDATGAEIWCVFDNTALGAATENALALQKQLRTRPRINQRRRATRAEPPA